MTENAATWPDGSPKTPDAVAAEVTGHTYGCNCLRCDEARVSSSAARPTFAAQLRQAIGDPGSIVVRRGLNRDGTHNAQPLESIVAWQTGAVVKVVTDHLYRRAEMWPDVADVITDLAADFADADRGERP